MNGVFQAAMAKMTERASGIAIYVTDPAEKSFVDKFGVRGAPMPLVLAIAPTGAATRPFPNSLKRPNSSRRLSALARPSV